MSYCIHRRVLLVALAAAPFLLAGEAFATDYVEEAVDPVLTLVGNSEMTVAKGETFTDPGAICTGKHVNEAGHKTVMGTPAVDTSVVGTHTLTYTCTDTRGVKAPDVSRTVKVVTKPVITLIGDANVTIELGLTHTDPGATCSGEAIPGGSKKVYAGSSVMNLGENTATYKCTDTRGISADPVTRTVTVVATPPTLTLNGDASATIQLGHTYSDPGATCSGLRISGGSKTVYADTANLVLGKNTLTYKCKDRSGISADPVTRTLTTTSPPPPPSPPTLTLNGDANVEVELPGPDTPQVRNSAYTDPGATCTGEAYPFGPKTIYANPFNLILGKNTLTYWCMDIRGQQTTITRTVTLVATPPTLTLNGPADAVHRGVQSNWRDLGATCTGQFIDGGSTTVYSAYRTLHPELIGKYTLTYACTDSRGVSANSVTGTVFIYGKPLHIELLGGSAVTITQGESWTDPGARCKNGGFSYAWRVYTDDSMDTEKVGTYTLNYKCKDYFGVWSDPVTRTVTVEPNRAAGTDTAPAGP